MAEKYEGQEPINVRRCDIERLKKKLAKARHDRDEWRKRAEAIEKTASDWMREAARKDRDFDRTKILTLQSEVAKLKAIIADDVVEKLTRRSRAAGGGE